MRNPSAYNARSIEESAFPVVSSYLFVFGMDNALKTILDCLQMVEAITNDSLCFEIHAEKRIDRRNPRVEFGMEEINEQKNIFSQNKASENHFHLSDEQEYQKE